MQEGFQLMIERQNQLGESSIRAVQRGHTPKPGLKPKPERLKHAARKGKSHHTDVCPALHEDRECMIAQADVDRLQSLHDQLVHEINYPDKLASHLYSQRAISKMEMEDVQAEKTRYKQVRELLNIVSRKPQHTFTAFTKALCMYNPRDLAELVANKQLEIGKPNHNSNKVL